MALKNLFTNTSSTLSSLSMEKIGEFFIIEPDPRVDGWFLMSSAWPTLYMIAGYVVLVTLVGPWFMKTRQPYDLRKTLVVYSAAQMLFSAWLFYKIGQAGWFHSYSFTCQPIDRSTSEMAMRMVYAGWWYYFSKLTEFCDTFFFVLRKKTEQVSALHVFHHGLMPLIWIGVKFCPGGHMSFFALLNTFVHIIMYFYYMMAAMGPRFSRFLWWKKYLTVMQITQFILATLHALQLVAYSDCEAGYPKPFIVMAVFYGFFFLFLFSDFYKSAYKSQKKTSQLVAKKEKSQGGGEKKITGDYSTTSGGLGNTVHASIVFALSIIFFLLFTESSSKSQISANHSSNPNVIVS